MKAKWQDRLNGDPVPWLLASNPWTRYRTLTDLLEYPSSSRDVKQARDELVSAPEVRQLIEGASDWLAVAPNRNSDPKISYFKLRMLADFGLSVEDEGIRAITDQATVHTEDGMFAVRGELPKRAKKGETFSKPDPYTDEWRASPCNSPIITYTLLALGVCTPQVERAVDQLRAKWQTPQGWFCHFFFVDGMYKKLQAGCPISLDYVSLLQSPEAMVSERILDQMNP
jgi:hypothetical protein